ncbi:MAG: TPM domain-containing protein [Selenomonadaceae bacterium]|nr:TPM domain-containing protein [Selenomonadaceae bacterium]
MRKIFCLTALMMALVMSIACAQTPVERGQSSIITSLTDSAQLLDSNDAQLLTDKIKSIENKHGVRIGVVTLKSARGLEINAIADNLLDDYFSGARNGSIVLTVVIDTRQWYISTDAQMKRRVTNEAGIPYLKEQFLTEMSQGDYATAFNYYIDAVDQLLTYYEQNETPYDPTSGFNPMAAVAAVVIAIVIAGVVRSSMIDAMSNVRHANEAIDYLVRNSVKVFEARDIFLFMNVSRQRKGGGRGGSGGGGGGGGHGGGGGSF